MKKTNILIATTFVSFALGIPAGLAYVPPDEALQGLYPSAPDSLVPQLYSPLPDLNLGNHPIPTLNLGDPPIPTLPNTSSSSSSVSSNSSSSSSTSTTSSSSSGGSNGSGVDPNCVAYGNCPPNYYYPPNYNYPPYGGYPSGSYYGQVPYVPAVSIGKGNSGAPLSHTGPEEYIAMIAMIIAISAGYTMHRALKAARDIAA